MALPIAAHLPPTRWTQLRPHPNGEAYTWSPHRFNTVPAGRRSGKTERAKRKLVKRALAARTPWAPRFFAGAPTRDQAKRIFWGDLKALVGRALMAGTPSETELVIRTVTGAEICVVGLDKPERIEGSPWDGGVIDEIANVKPTAWSMNVRPALSDRRGWCDLIGVPEGRNHYYDLDTKARADMLALGAASEWGSFTWFSEEVLPPEEIEAAMRDLDELTFLQEYRASFINFEGRAYYVFDQRTHCAPLAYDPRAPLGLCFDFNVAPGVCAVVQEQAMPGKFERAKMHAVVKGQRVMVEDPSGAPLLDRPMSGTGVIAEVHIPRNSNTPAVCRKLLEMFGEHRGPVRCYGDATGGADGSAKVQGSDWELIDKALRPKFRERLEFRVKAANPAERARVNAVNSRLLSAMGDVRMMVDARRAPNTVKDLDGVTLLKGGSGEIDKKATPHLTHLSDGLGYYVEYEFPVSGPGMVRAGLSGH